MTALTVTAAIVAALCIVVFVGSFAVSAVLGERRQARRDRGWR